MLSLSPATSAIRGSDHASDSVPLQAWFITQAISSHHKGLPFFGDFSLNATG
jgi:hypothetical protein